ncbi:MAG TPA: GDCCVxC domain-containing (seleno)protein [Candidatus Acidoferrum sp.]|nr:GDCCVxC domain-containing (seleno)protein [Candidatus Acidoferrum sp.]
MGKITCPVCGHVTTEVIPTDRCLFFFECPGCGKVLRPKTGDCCVFCSYADRRCPSSLR